MLEFKLAFRNVKNGGLKTWLNVAVLSFIYVLIIWHQGIFEGMLRQATRSMIQDDIAGGQYWHKDYDSLDPLSYEDGHGKITGAVESLVKSGKATPVLIRPAAIYPGGRIQNILLRGIDPDQSILGIPSSFLRGEEEGLPVLIGTRMSKKTELKTGDYITIRWRDVNGTFDAVEGKIAGVMKTKVPSIDNGQLWVPLDKLQQMTVMENEATMVIVSRDLKKWETIKGWPFKDHEFLLKDINAMVDSKKSSSYIMYAVLMFLAMLAVFDTQVLAIFKRRKEIGTLIALGMTRRQVVRLFTLEGAMHGILAIAAAALYGVPWIIYFAKTGMKMPRVTETYGFALADRLFPVYSIGLVVVTISIVMLTVIIVSFLPSRGISKMRPTDALRGKIS